MPVIALTGATGFAGRSIVRHLASARPQATLRLLVRNASSRPLDPGLSEHEIVEGDLGDVEALSRLVAGADAVVHAAAAIAGNCAADFDRANVAGTRRVVDAVLARASDAHFIHVSSLAARSPSLSWYAASKRAAEEIVGSRLMRFSVLRPPAVYGPGDPALADFWRLLARGWLLRLGPSRARFSLLHVDDLAETISRLAAADPAGTVVTATGPQPAGGWGWDDIAQAARNARRGPIRVLAVPGIVLRGAAISSLAWGRVRRRPALLAPGKARELLHPDWVCDNLALEAALGWRPTTPLQQALGTLPGWINQ